MTHDSTLESLLNTLDKADVALEELDANCCVPHRSPRMQAIGAALQSARVEVTAVKSEQEATAAIESLEAIGAQIGALQVSCCAPSRLPLYASMLTDLTTAQRTLTREFRLDH